MKKVISLILVVALFAALAICASADVVPHDHSDDAFYNYLWSENPDGVVTGVSSTWPALPDTDALVMLEWVDGTGWVPMGNTALNDVKVLSITEGAKQTLTSCAQAITAAELQAVVDADERIENLTVFRQRNIEEAEGTVDISVKLWPCAPDKHPAHATVILFRAEGEETWTVAGYAADEVCDATLTGNGAYVVCLAW